MALYAIGDLQGCHAEFVQLLELIGFSPARDRLWLVGDLVNRGPGSLPILREVKALGDAAHVVLGNHDLHLLTVAAGHRPPHRSDTLDDVLAAPDRDELLDWLDDAAAGRARGRAPDGARGRAARLDARRTARMLVGRGRGEARERRRPPLPGRALRRRAATWRDDLDGDDRLRAIVNVCTRLRFCTADGTHGVPREARPRVRAGRLPAVVRARASRRTARETVVCGHWSTLELDLAPNVLMLDSGCLWGGTLTAIRLPDRRVFQVPSRHPV